MRNSVLETLGKHGLLQKELQIHSQYVGVHPENRYGDGIVPADVIRLLEGIFSTGFSVSELDKPTACELPRRPNVLG